MAAKTEDDVSHLEIYVYEEAEENLYTHHDVMLPAFPLCLEWLDFRLGRKAGLEGTGNYVAIGTFEPDIEIWDIDTVDNMYPDAILGQSNSKETSAKKKKRSKKVNKAYHTDAVMSLSWNKLHRNILASASADTTVKLWDLSNETCVHSLHHHSDKVQSVEWHPVESTILLSGSYDKNIAVLDSRASDRVAFWKTRSDVECLRWDPHNPNYFYASMEDGLVQYFDVRNVQGTAGQSPIFTLHAHDEPVSALDINPLVRGCIVTGSTDKTVKVWDIKDGKPSMIASRDFGVGKVFASQFCPDSPFQLAIAGSKGKVHIWDMATNAGIRRAFEGQGIVLNVTVEEKPTVQLADDAEGESSDDDNEENEAEMAMDDVEDESMEDNEGESDEEDV
ncbi:hypothetical protein BZG36_01169 [Bifiguratus adelaidae]|uniref:Anaphase-promoting complex subunit 4-like WD40 domain-containing protein n=1 Tax=Bifiguratus adelaidae TaxID=1938954 RepID=A0A261Y5S9_9FUNG|nr:hypothetical protein BZG36_01169 [Bifiguratus adelaidae]